MAERVAQTDRPPDGVGAALVIVFAPHPDDEVIATGGTICRHREAGDREVVWTVNPGHPITRGVPEAFVIPEQEMYGEYFDVPPPDALIFISSFTGGEVFRSGMTFTRGQGRVFYFSPGHETHPVYFQPEVRRVIANGVAWAYQEPRPRHALTRCVNSPTGWFENREG